MNEELINLYVGPDGVVKLEPVLDEEGNDITKEILQVEAMPILEEKLYYKPILMYDGTNFYCEFEIDEVALYKERNRIKAFLNKTDHIVLKMSEARMLDLPLPYPLSDIEARVSERLKLQEIDILLGI